MKLTCTIDCEKDHLRLVERLVEKEGDGWALIVSKDYRRLADVFASICERERGRHEGPDYVLFTDHFQSLIFTPHPPEQNGLYDFIAEF